MSYSGFNLVFYFSGPSLHSDATLSVIALTVVARQHSRSYFFVVALLIGLILNFKELFSNELFLKPKTAF